MRNENLTANRRIELARVQGYHERENYSQNYAFQGFGTENRYFTSDRYEVLNENMERPNGKPLRAFGLEIETECSSIINQTVYANLLDKVIFKTFPDGLFKMQDDGSLGGNTSAECITQLMTKEFIRNNYKNFKTMWEYFSNFGITTENNTCGMHVNISNAFFGANTEKQEIGAKKLYYVINKHFDFFKVALNRTNSTRYCALCYDYENAKTTPINRLVGQGHGSSMNMSHFSEGRIELRLVGGQKNYACFRNTMETVFHLLDNLKSLSWDDLDDLTKVFKGCNNYVFDRISSNCLRQGVISRDDVEKIRETVISVTYL